MGTFRKHEAKVLHTVDWTDDKGKHAVSTESQKRLQSLIKHLKSNGLKFKLDTNVTFESE